VSRWPIRVRVTAAFALALAVVLAATGAFLYVRLDSMLRRALDRDLALRAEDLAALVGDPAGKLPSTAAGPFVERGESYAQLLAPSGRVLDATYPLRGHPLLDARVRHAALSRSIYLDIGPIPGLDEPSRLLATPVRRAGRLRVLVVGATLADRAETLSSFRTELFIAGPLALLVASGVGWVLAGMSLAQVEAMRRRAAAISAETPGERLPVPPTGDELERLGVTLNEMLGRLEHALQRERDFVADAGHELRTPLALLRTELELALRHDGSAEGLRVAVRRSSTEVERLSQLAEDLLLIARSDGGRLALQVEDIDVRVLLESSRSRFEWRAAEEGRPIVVAATDGDQVRGDRVRLEQALGNLVDNALRHGGGRIVLGSEAEGTVTKLHVRDEGAGFPADFRDRAFERFSRADSSRGRGGVGLGLAIVAEIARAHGGVVGIDASEVGADVWLVLPSR
jgi:two-component system OmpR family sensor kinase